MAALPEYGVDPESQEPMEMPQDGEIPPELAGMMGGPEAPVDPNSPPADPMLQQEPDEEYEHAGGEVEYRETVEMCVLGAIERAAKGVEVGEGAANPQFVQAYAQAAAALGQCYESLTRSEQSEKKLGIDALGALQQSQSSPSTS